MALFERTRQRSRRISRWFPSFLVAVLAACVCFVDPMSTNAATTVLYQIVGAQRIRVSNGNQFEFPAAIRNSSDIIYSPERSFVIKNEGGQLDNYLLESCNNCSFIIPNARCNPFTGASTICGVLSPQQEFTFSIRYSPHYGISRTEQQFDFNNGQFNGGISFHVAANAYYLEANAGPHQTVNAGEVVTLRGAGSYPPTSTFRWSLILWPNGTPQPTLTTSTATDASFRADSPGLYRAQFTVTFNGFTHSDLVDIAAVDPRRPELRLDQMFVPNSRRIFPGDTVAFGTVLLNANAPKKSFEIRNIGDAPLNLDSVVLPIGVNNAPPFIPFPSVLPATTGFALWDFQLSTSSEINLDGIIHIGNDSKVNPFSFRVTGRVVRLRANAGQDRFVRIPIGSSVSVDASASLPMNDPDATFSWSFDSRPSGSSASFADPAAKSTSFVPDVSGTFVVRLTTGLAGGTESDTATIRVQRGQTFVGSIGVIATIPHSIVYGRSPFFGSSIRRGVVVRNTQSGETRFASADISTGHFEVNDIADGTYSLQAYSHDAGLNLDYHFTSDAKQAVVRFEENPVAMNFEIRPELIFRDAGTIQISLVDLWSLLDSAKTLTDIVTLYFTGGAGLIPKKLAEEAVEELVEKVLQRPIDELLGYYEIEWVTANTWNPQTGEAEAIVVSEKGSWVRPNEPRETFFERTSKDAVWTTAHSPVSLVIEDPDGLRLGRDGLSDTSYFDLLGGYEEGDEEKNLLLSEEAVAPYYRLYVYGLDTGTYSLDVRLFRSFPVLMLQVTNVATTRGQVDVYYIGSPSTSNHPPMLRRNHTPTKPGLISSSNVTVESAVVSWGSANDPDGDAVSYEVQYGQNGSIYPATITANTFATLSGLKPHTTYLVRVRARDPFGGVSDWREASPPFTTLNRTPITPGPIAVSNISFTSAIIAWDISSDADGDAITYEIEQRTSGDSSWSTVGSTRLTSRAILGLNLNTTYDLRVRARDEYGGVSSWREDAMIFTTLWNDAFASSLRLTGSFATVIGTNVRATKEPGEPNHGGDAGGKSLWWVWTAPATGVATVETRGSSFDTLLSAYTGVAVNTLTTEASDDDSGGSGTSRVNLLVLAGQTYHFAVDGFSGSSGEILLKLWFAEENGPPFLTNPSEFPTAIVGEAYSAPLVVVGSGGLYDVRVVSGTLPPGLSLISEAAGVNGVPTTSGNYSFRVRVAGTTGLSAQKDFTLQVIPPSTRPLNDNFLSAFMLDGAGASVSAVNQWATREPNEPVHANMRGGSSVWWEWTAPTPGLVIIDTIGSDFDTLLGVYRGNAVSDLTPIASNDDIGAGSLQSQTEFQALAGTTYRIAVDGFEGDSGHLRLNLRLPDALPYFFTPTIGNSGIVLFKLRPTLGRTDYLIEASSDLETWDVVTNILSANAVIQFSLPIAVNSSQRFFRAVVPLSPGR